MLAANDSAPLLHYSSGAAKWRSKMKRQKILPDPPQYRTDIQVMTDRQGNSFAVQKATGQKMIMVSHDVIDSIEYRQLSDGASCLYLRLCQATNVDFREERKGKWKYVLGQTAARREAEMLQQLCGHEKRKVVRGWLQNLMEIGLIERLVDSEGRLAFLVRG